MRTATRWWGRYEGDMLTQTEDGELLHDPLQMTIYRGRILDVLISGVRVAVQGPSFFGGRIHFTALATPSHPIHCRGNKAGCIISGQIDVPSINASGTFSVRLRHARV